MAVPYDSHTEDIGSSLALDGMEGLTDSDSVGTEATDGLDHNDTGGTHDVTHSDGMGGSDDKDSLCHIDDTNWIHGSDDHELWDTDASTTQMAYETMPLKKATPQTGLQRRIRPWH